MKTSSLQRISRRSSHWDSAPAEPEPSGWDTPPQTTSGNWTAPVRNGVELWGIPKDEVKTWDDVAVAPTTEVCAVGGGEGWAGYRRQVNESARFGVASEKTHKMDKHMPRPQRCESAVGVRTYFTLVPGRLACNKYRWVVDEGDNHWIV
jgi:hypothetical protein